ncbi:MAG TPA: Sir2 family NAD-dependent protein deacetylase [Chitinophagaceae bacterium]|nr:Sir2 family NAD-dependent protein deacetylase [Chitinophagaceae bacterium]
MKKKLVIFSGAGISAESGIPTFRDQNGIWETHRIEEVATPQAWASNPKLVLKFYNERRRKILKVNPNKAHLEIKKLEEFFEVVVITQNIDDLHERAGSKNVLHLHGEIFKMRSEKNSNLVYPTKNDIKVGQLAEDGEQLRPHIVWFFEEVPMMEKAIEIVKQCDYFVVIGSSLVVYPAASLISYVPQNALKFIIDPQIPNHGDKDIFVIQKPATEGIIELATKLKN